MNSKDLRLIGEAYTNINNSQEQLDEFLGPDAAKAVDKVTKAGQNLLRKAGVPINDTKRGTVTKAEQQKKIEQNKMEDVDFFDTIKGHLMSEGYADTEEAALVIMANMSEEWRTEIIEGIIGQTADNIARTVGTAVGTGERVVRELPGYLTQKVKNVKGTFDSARERASSNNPNVRSGRMTRSRTPSASPGTKSQKPNSSVSSPGYDTRRIGGYDLRRLPAN